MKKNLALILSCLFCFTYVIAQPGDNDNEAEKIHQSVMNNNGYMDLPGVQYIGDPIKDAATYEAAKMLWYEENGGAPFSGGSNILPPPNDACAGAITIAPGVPVIGETLTATPEVQPFCGTGDGVAGAVWYTFTGLDAGVTLSTCGVITDYDTKVRVYSGICGALVCVVGNDDACPGFKSIVNFIAQSTNTYYILVHGFGGAAGNFELTMATAPLPPNDSPCNAIALPANGSTPFDNSFATADLGEVTPGPGTDTGGGTCDANDGWCSFETAVQSSLWYRFTSPEAGGCLDIGLDNTLDLQFAIWEVGDCSDYNTFVEVGANDDGGASFDPRIIVNDNAAFSCLMPGQTYYLQVDGFGTTTGTSNITTTSFDDVNTCCQEFVIIPTMGEWGIIILALSLMIFGVIFMFNQARKKDRLTQIKVKA